LLLGLLALSVGCGPSSKARGIVKGKVTFAGKALPSGNVGFFGANNLTGTGIIDKDGNYTILDAPLGEVKISVTVPQGPPPGMMMGPGMAASKGMTSVDPSGSGKSIPLLPTAPTNVMPIPEKYAKPETSGLTLKVEKGEQTHDITLNP